MAFTTANGPQSTPAPSDEDSGDETGLTRTYLPGIGYAYTAAKDIPEAACVIDLRRYATDVPVPTKYSIQIGVDTHIDGIGTRYLNHSCEPNMFIDAETRTAIAVRPLKKGEILSFFYPANEWSMSLPFECNCATDQCIGMVVGAVDLPSEVLRRYRLNPHIAKLSAEMGK